MENLPSAFVRPDGQVWLNRQLCPKRLSRITCAWASGSPVRLLLTTPDRLAACCSGGASVCARATPLASEQARSRPQTNSLFRFIRILGGHLQVFGDLVTLLLDVNALGVTSVLFYKIFDFADAREKFRRRQQSVPARTQTAEAVPTFGEQGNFALASVAPIANIRGIFLIGENDHSAGR